MEKLDILQGTLDLMILTILAREPMHGYGISQRLAVLSHDQFHVNPGSLFPSLYRLEQDGKLRAEWRPTENNRRAKYYRLTASGRWQLEQHRERWNRVSLPLPVCWRAHDAPASPRIDGALARSPQQSRTGPA